MKKILFLFIILSVVSFAQSKQTLIDQKAPKIYVSGNFYDLQFLKEQIPVVDFVNDRKDADVHILISGQSTGSGGTLNTLFFYGQNQFDKINDTLKVTTDLSDSDDARRIKLTKGIKNGLFNYLRRSGVADQMSINFTRNTTEAPVKKEDPWDSWVFRTSFNGFFNGEASTKYSSMSGSFSANRTTEDLRLSFSYSNSYRENSYNYDEEGINYEFKDITRSQSLNTSAVKSLSDHWSLGLWGSAYKSTYGNIDLNWALSTGIEYNFYPYSESSDKSLTFSYKIGTSFNKYFEETIYFKQQENLFTQTASISLGLTKPWGSVSASIDGSNYFQDMKKYYLSFNTYFSVKLVKGLSIYTSLYYSKINNQIALPRSGASVEDVLLRIRQLETQYSYYASVGISFSFGSIFNNIVNPRFGGGGSVMYFE